MSTEAEIDGVFSSGLFKTASSDMGAIEKKIFGAVENPDVANRLSAFLLKLKEDGSLDIQKSEDLEKSSIKEMFDEATLNLTMEQLVEFFSTLEKLMSEDEFERLFQSAQVNDARFEHVRKIATVNLMFSPAFRRRIADTIEISKGWWL